MLWTFDTEDDSKGRVYWVDFFNGVEHVSFDNPDRAAEWIYGQEGEFWAVNLEYDLINLFGPLMDHLLVLTYGGFGLLKAHIYQRAVQFRNTLRHWPMSVEEMGQRLGYPKLPFDPTNLEYCRRDTEVTWFFIKEMFKRYTDLGIEEIKATLPSTSLAFFTTKYCKVPWFRHPDPNVWAFLSESRYGGRCEIFRTGPITGHIHEYDINSSYPYAMQANPFPVLDSIQVGVKRPDFDRAGVARCTVACPPMQFPVLPYKEAGGSKLLFPVGRFTGTWTFPELREALTMGYKIERIHEAVQYDLGDSPFAEYMGYIYALRQTCKDTDPLMSYTLKILMNALFGKWGEEGELTVISRGKRHTMKQLPKHSNMVWAAYVLAYGRMQLYTHMVRASGVGELLYTDTDSIFVKTRSGSPPFEGSNALGQLGYKGHHRLAHFKLPKLYQVDDHYKAKGVPNDKQHRFPDHLKKAFFNEEIAEFLKPYRWLEAKKLKEQANVWHVVSKQIQSEYDKRITRPDGRTWPLTIAEQPGKKPHSKRSLETM